MANAEFLDGQGALKRLAFPSGDGSALSPFAGYGGDILTQLQATVAALASVLAELELKPDADATLAVTGPLTDAELRASAVPVSVATLPDVTLTRVAVTTQAAAYAASGDNTVIAAPGAGNQLVISSIVVQNESANATTVLLKSGAITKRRALLQNQGDGVAWTFAPGREWRLGDNAGLLLNLSGANSHGVTVDYWTEVV